MRFDAFILPMVVGLVGSAYFVFFTEEDWKWKVLAAGIMAASLLLQFVPALQVHFIIPVILQTAVAIWMIIYWKLDR